MERPPVFSSCVQPIPVKVGGVTFETPFQQAANQNLLTGTGSAGLIVGTNLPGNVTYPNGVTNAFIINAGKFLNVYCNSGGGTLNKWNNGSILILSGNNTYSGGTIIAAGKFISKSENSLGGGPLSIASVASLQLEFVGSINATSLSLGGSSMANGNPLICYSMIPPPPLLPSVSTA